MKRRLGLCFLIVALIGSIVALPVPSAEAQTNVATPRLVVPVQGTVNGATNTLTGSFAVNRFAVQNGQLVAVGTLTASVLDGAGNIVRSIVRPVALPVAAV